MKRVVLSVLVTMVAFSGVSFAAASKMGVGVYVGGLGTGPVNGFTSTYIPTLSFQATKDMNLEFGLAIGSVTNTVKIKDLGYKGASDSQFDILIKGDMALQGISHIGAALIFTSDTNYLMIKDGESASGFGLGIYWGVRSNIATNCAVSFDIYPLTYSSLSEGGGSISTLGLGKVAIEGIIYL